MSADSRSARAEVSAAAQELIARYGWRVVRVEPLVQRVLDWIAAGADLSGPYAMERICERAAAEQLHAACIERPQASEAEKQRQEQAYRDLSRWLSIVARRLRQNPAPGVSWEIVVQNTLVAVFLKVADCKEPQNFLAFAARRLEWQRLNSWRQLARQAKREESLEQLQNPDDADDGRGREIASPDGDASASVMADGGMDLQGNKELFAALHDCLRNDQQRIIFLGEYLGLRRQDIMLTFGMPGMHYDNTKRSMAKRLLLCGRFLAYADRAPQRR